MECVLCGKEVFVDNSFSNRGENVQCTHCVTHNAQELHIGIVDYCRTYVWPYRNSNVDDMLSKLIKALGYDPKQDRG